MDNSYCHKSTISELLYHLFLFLSKEKAETPEKARLRFYVA